MVTPGQTPHSIPYVKGAWLSTHGVHYLIFHLYPIIDFLKNNNIKIWFSLKWTRLQFKDTLFDGETHMGGLHNLYDRDDPITLAKRNRILLALT